jgi:TRAP transporter TAXI family solute receptor
MKRIILISLLVMLLLISALGTFSSMAKITQIKFVGSSPGGSWYMVMTGVAEVIKKSIPNVLITVAPGEGATNPIVVGNKEAELGLTHNVTSVAIVKGLSPFEKAMPNIRTICAVYGSTYQFIVREDTGLKSVQDIVDKKYPLKLSVSDPGSGDELVNGRYFEEYGMSFKDIDSWGGKIHYKNYSESSSMIKDRLIDGFAIQTLHPSASVTAIEVDVDLTMLTLAPEVIKALNEKYGYGITVIPAGTYSFLKEDYPTTITSTVIVTHADVPEELIYNITKAIAENLDYMRNVHVALKGMTLQSMMTGTGAPLHDGAKRYYEEQGLKVD